MEKPSVQRAKTPTLQSIREFMVFTKSERLTFGFAVFLVMLSTVTIVATPYYVARAIDHAIVVKDSGELVRVIVILLGLYLVTLVTGYLQTRLMGTSSQRVLFNLRQALFSKIQNLPMGFFGGAKTGDLISRLNNDTERINQFMSEGVIRFTNILLSLIGIGAFMLYLNAPLALAALAACMVILIGTQVASPWVQRVNKQSLEAVGDLTAISQESLQNFKVIVAYNRQKYMQETFEARNVTNRAAAMKAQIASGIFTPIYKFASNIAQLIVLGVGAYLMYRGQMTLGVLIAFIAYVQRFYEPLLILASFWGNLQGALAAWTRVREILAHKELN